MRKINIQMLLVHFTLTFSFFAIFEFYLGFTNKDLMFELLILSLFLVLLVHIHNLRKEKTNE